LGKRRAAEELGISESTLYRRIRELGIRSASAVEAAE
jgi:transcriptional regulator of acetoin/glycerol metabolism